MEDPSASFGQMLLQARSGDRTAQGRILEGNRLWLKSTARRWLPARLSRRQDASDLARECLVAAANQITQFRGDDAHTFRSWLGGIQRNLVRRLVRSEGARVDREGPLSQLSSSDGYHVADEATPIPEAAAHRERMDWLLRAVNALDTEDRWLVQQKFLCPVADNPTYEELAGKLKCTNMALRQRMGRLLKRLERGIVLMQVMEQHALPAHYRQILSWSYVRGWSIARIAAELGCPERSARRLLEQAENRLPPCWDRVA